MGLNYRKSFKIGKNTRVNVSKTGGIGISTGTKGVRVSVNKKGVRTQVGSNGMYYRDQYNFKNNSNTSYEAELISTDNISHNLPKELKAKASTKQWVLVLIGLFSVLIGSQNDSLIVLFIGIIFCIWSLFCKDTRASLKYNMATFHFFKGNFDKSLNYAYKSRYIKDTEQVNKLIGLIIEKTSK
ncbi:hypothetical protein CLOHAE12215_01328 [Clostridium haemolyticum]|uniref:DUF4236 domain-containing protein n=1 Tax=Clostridium TaxID=1485 RepID=UPI001C3B7F2C|nr:MULTISPECIES: DUF4236 domain-containing protein [Clostridium]MCD3245258.1 DUF4236 domain-containing protein [Clostridium botulinum C]MCD3261637.1 DUF4236 domain-containing protein [Clostridium botulinum C]CAG7839912.1 hypothetical protein CLOHAE12215_01328 [Clostridium haemolyticum]